jgi:hypothetical protein
MSKYSNPNEEMYILPEVDLVVKIIAKKEIK